MAALLIANKQEASRKSSSDYSDFDDVNLFILTGFLWKFVKMIIYLLK